MPKTAGVLKTQTLRNADGEDYRALIDAFAREIGAATTTLPSGKPTPLEEAIDTITDLDVRTRLRMVLVENVRQREEISRLRQAFKHLQSNTMEQRTTIKEVELLPSTKANIDLAPIEKFISDTWTEERRWIKEPNGAIYDDNGECLAPIGFTTSLLTVLRLAGGKM